MKFGVREICNVVFKAKSQVKIGNTTFPAGAPVLYIDTAKTSTLEGAATTVYATGGRGNARLLTWEGEKTLTFTVEDALLSPMGFALLSGAGLFEGSTTTTNVNVHMTATATVSTPGDDAEATTIDIVLGAGEELSRDADAQVYVYKMDGDEITGAPLKGTISTVSTEDATKPNVAQITVVADGFDEGDTVWVDCYIKKAAENVSELQIDAEHFAGYYYVEANCLFKRKKDGVDLPAELTFPKVKIQSNFSFAMGATGDPSTFTFTMDAMPDYTYFNKKRKVLCAMQIVKDADGFLATDDYGSMFALD